jgi:hypothetical protein
MSNGKKCGGEIHIDAKIDQLEVLLQEISECDFTTSHQVIGLIQSNLDSCKKTKLKMFGDEGNE